VPHLWIRHADHSITIAAMLEEEPEILIAKNSAHRPTGSSYAFAFASHAEKLGSLILR
jgi:hypothetical protein